MRGQKRPYRKTSRVFMKKVLIMKMTNTLPRQTALIAALILSSSAWLSAQTSGNQSGQPANRSVRQTDSSVSDANASSQTEAPMKINKGSTIIGATVKNQQGETLGKIHDLVINLNSEQVAYAVLDSGTGLLSAQKLHAVPLRAFQPGTDGKTLILNADKDQLARSEGFDKNSWPAMNSSAWGAQPFWKDSQGTSDAQEKNPDRQYKDKAKELEKAPQSQN